MKFINIYKKIFIINALVILIFFWVAEYYLDIIKYRPSYINEKKLSKVISLKKEIENEYFKEVQKLINKGFEPNLYPTTSLSLTKLKKISNATNFLPLGAQPNKKVYLCDEGYGFIKYKTDHLGFRNNINDWGIFPYNAIIIGDSYVHGNCVTNENTISGHLKKFGIQNINLGQGDNGAAVYLQLLDQFSKPIPPKNIVLVLSLHNDFMGDEIAEEYKTKRLDYIYSDLKKKHILSNNGFNYFKLTNKEMIKMIEEKKLNIFNDLHNQNKRLISILKLTKIRQLLKKEFNILINKNFFCIGLNCIIGDIEELLKFKTSNSMMVVSNLLDICNYRTNCNPIVVLISASIHWDNSIDTKILRKYINQEIINIQKKKFEFSYIDTAELFDISNLDNYAPAGGHLSNLGYKKIANEIKIRINSK
jgi:lysophospholipase L1-like esterase